MLLQSASPPTDPASVDRFFTEQVVGLARVVTLGPSDSLQRQPDHGVRVNALERSVHLHGVAAAVLWAAEPVRALAGAPLPLQDLLHARRRVVGLGALAVAGAVSLAWGLGLWWWLA